MSEPIFSPEITLFTRSGVVKPRRSINILFKLSYLCDLKGWSRTSLTSEANSPESAAHVRLYAHHRHGFDKDRTVFRSD